MRIAHFVSEGTLAFDWRLIPADTFSITEKSTSNSLVFQLFPWFKFGYVRTGAGRLACESLLAFIEAPSSTSRIFRASALGR